ncbi:DUF4956 domain-containing protein [Butyrivibrio sp. MC2013]|uniref:DUF4956 domain-containing protein n=1 Tax=Butyrivibrio sp. MC2013 TaxID=1280686 RepID=UPI0004009C4E|nr:DUF4956 domain-containing protein [Butyrivibrio sp. MC2013]
MFNSFFTSIISNGEFTGATLLIATAVALICGLIIAASYIMKNKCSQSYALTLVLLPAIVELVIILVNGNIGAGVAVAGAFSLVRFRSVAGKGQEITSIFLAMAVGLATGMGYVGVALGFTILISVIAYILNMLHFGQDNDSVRALHITVPENLDYEGRFEDLFTKYLKSFEYKSVKTTNMGSLYKISIDVILKEGISTKEFLDELRTRNGNLDISLQRPAESADAL